MNFKNAVHQVIRNKYCISNSESNLASELEYSTSQNIYYTKELKYNLYKEMDSLHFKQYGKGRGGELRESGDSKKRPMKMKSIRSSSALAYNTFGNNIVEFKVNKYGIPPKKYIITYEKNNRLIKGERFPVSSWADVFLVSEDGEDCILVEVKMLEWLLNKPKAISEKYLIEDYYFSSFVGKNIIPTIKKVLTNNKIEKDNKFYVEPINNQYDSIQMLLHTIGFLTEYQLGNLKGMKRFYLMNMIWTLDDIFALGKYQQKYKTMYAIEIEQSNSFKNFFESNLKPIFKNSFSLESSFIPIEHRELVNILNLDDNHRKYLLNRY